MWSKNKSSGLTTVLAATAADASVVIPSENRREFSIQLNYGTGTGTATKLQASLDGVNYADVTDSDVTMDNAGGMVLWNVTDFQSLFCKVVITGDSIDNEVLLGAFV